MTPVPLFTLFALKAFSIREATNSNNVKGGTLLAKARWAMSTLLGWVGLLQSAPC